MNIPKAIKTLEQMSELNLNFYSPDRRAALELGIEALKRVKDLRNIAGTSSSAPLPGEF
jgi:hypothetical protein